MSMKVADLCLRAQEGGSHMFGKPVALAGLTDQTMNGQVGIALGYDVDSGRRSVSLPNGQGGRRKVAIKPENLRLVDGADDTSCRSTGLNCGTEARTVPTYLSG